MPQKILIQNLVEKLTKGSEKKTILDEKRGYYTYEAVKFAFEGDAVTVYRTSEYTGESDMASEREDRTWKFTLPKTTVDTLLADLVTHGQSELNDVELTETKYGWKPYGTATSSNQTYHTRLHVVLQSDKEPIVEFSPFTRAA
jgi:hypothetical protein